MHSQSKEELLFNPFTFCKEHLSPKQHTQKRAQLFKPSSYISKNDWSHDMFSSQKAPINMFGDPSADDPDELREQENTIRQLTGQKYCVIIKPNRKKFTRDQIQDLKKQSRKLLRQNYHRCYITILKQRLKIQNRHRRKFNLPQIDIKVNSKSQKLPDFMTLLFAVSVSSMRRGEYYSLQKYQDAIRAFWKKNYQKQQNAETIQDLFGQATQVVVGEFLVEVYLLEKFYDRRRMEERIPQIFLKLRTWNGLKPREFNQNDHKERSKRLIISFFKIWDHQL